MFDTQIDTITDALSWLPSDMVQFVIIVLTFMLLIAIVRVFLR